VTALSQICAESWMRADEVRVITGDTAVVPVVLARLQPPDGDAGSSVYLAARAVADKQGGSRHDAATAAG